MKNQPGPKLTKTWLWCEIRHTVLVIKNKNSWTIDSFFQNEPNLEKTPNAFFDLFNENDTNLTIKRTKKKETHDYSLNKHQ